MKEGDVLMFAHGFNIHFNLIKPAEDIDVIMVTQGSGTYGKESVFEGKVFPALSL